MMSSSSSFLASIGDQWFPDAACFQGSTEH